LLMGCLVIVIVLLFVYLLMLIAEDKKLPSVEPIRVTLPENYPQNSPTCTALPHQSGNNNSNNYLIVIIVC